MVNQLQLTNKLLLQLSSPYIFGGERMVNQLQLTNKLLSQTSSPCILGGKGVVEGCLQTRPDQNLLLICYSILLFQFFTKLTSFLKNFQWLPISIQTEIFFRGYREATVGRNGLKIKICIYPSICLKFYSYLSRKVIILEYMTYACMQIGNHLKFLRNGINFVKN